MTAATAVAVEKAMVGQPAPDFEMASTKNIEKLNEPVKLSDYRGKWLVMVFYPLDFTFVCPTELTTFSDRYQDFEDIGADIIGISTDSVYLAPCVAKHGARQGRSRRIEIPVGG